MSNCKILFSGFRDHSHSKAGGYDWITGYGRDSDVLMLSDMPFGNIPLQKWIVRMPLAFLDIVTRLRRYRYDIVHLIYGDVTMLRFLPYRKSKKHRTVITVHMDIERRKFKKSFISQLRSFDKIIVLSRCQAKELKERYGLDSEFIPHGFDCPKYKNVEVRDERGNRLDEKMVNIVTVGKMYRDYDLYRRVVSAHTGNDNIRFHLVGAPDDVKSECRAYGNVHVYGRLGDDEYYSLLSRADYCFLPLMFATANNALLESQYLDLPLILPLIEGVSDYAAPAPMNRFYSTESELNAMINSLGKSVKDGSLAAYASRFSWENIYKRLEATYNSLKYGQ